MVKLWPEKTPERCRLLLLTLPLLLLLTIGPSGYMLFESTSFLNGLYLTVITITTVGYGDIAPATTGGRVFTVLLVFSGAGYVMYIFSQITEAMVEGGLQHFAERRKMHKTITQMRNHYIICGFGRIGQEICSILQENRRAFVIIEHEDSVIEAISRLGYPFLKGDAADDEILLAAGILEARGLVTAVSSDEKNVYITLTARELNQKLFILARSSGISGADKKLKRAGATRVISPYSIGARRMAQLIVRPTVVDFLDLAMQVGDLGLRMEELVVSGQAAWVGKTLIETEVRQKYGIIVVAIKRRDAPMLFNPGSDAKVMAGDILIVLGEGGRINALAATL
jgi:voltage-gated potassium channel